MKKENSKESVSPIEDINKPSNVNDKQMLVEKNEEILPD